MAAKGRKNGTVEKPLSRYHELLLADYGAVAKHLAAARDGMFRLMCMMRDDWTARIEVDNAFSDVWDTCTMYARCLGIPSEALKEVRRRHEEHDSLLAGGELVPKQACPPRNSLESRRKLGFPRFVAFT